MAGEDVKPPSIPSGADQFARALGSYLPTRMKQTRILSRQIRAFGRAKPKRPKGGG